MEICDNIFRIHSPRPRCHTENRSKTRIEGEIGDHLPQAPIFSLRIPDLAKIQPRARFLPAIKRRFGHAELATNLLGDRPHIHLAQGLTSLFRVERAFPHRSYILTKVWSRSI